MELGRRKRVRRAAHSGGAKAVPERASESSGSKKDVGLPSVEAVFGGKHDRFSTDAARRASMFPRSHARRTRASVCQEDIPDVLKRMSEMQIFSSSAGDTVENAGGRSPTRSKAPLLSSREPDRSAVLYDIDALRAAFSALKQAFPPHWKHCLAIKSCPLPLVIQEAVDAGLGIEAASFAEMYMGLVQGCPADVLAFDSPAKTNEELEMALARGVLVNANSLVELDRIAAIIERQGFSNTTRVGIRLNPLIGVGSIAELSVSTSTSKFAVPLIGINVMKIVEAFRKWPWLVALHTHVGSQGYALDQLAKGIAALCQMADNIDFALGKGRVTLLDIGGGLPANYDAGEVSPTFKEYAAMLKKAAPSLFNRHDRTVVTEFGRALLAKTAITVSVVEYTRSNTRDPTLAPDADTAQDIMIPNFDKAGNMRSSLDHQTLVTHVGADLFLRTSYCPGKFFHRLSTHTRTGEPLDGPLITTDVAGPLCFQGDYVARDARLPRTSPGDLVVVHDTGANTLSLFSRHCSRRSPAVYGYVRDADGKVFVRLVKEKESVQDVARFWGA